MKVVKCSNLMLILHVRISEIDQLKKPFVLLFLFLFTVSSELPGCFSVDIKQVINKLYVKN